MESRSVGCAVAEQTENEIVFKVTTVSRSRFVDGKKFRANLLTEMRCDEMSGEEGGVMVIGRNEMDENYKTIATWIRFVVEEEGEVFEGGLVVFRRLFPHVPIFLLLFDQ